MNPELAALREELIETAKELLHARVAEARAHLEERIDAARARGAAESADPGRRRQVALPRLEPSRRQVATVLTLAEAWQAARVDVSEGTAQTYRVALGRLLPRIGDVPAAELAPSHVADLVPDLAAGGLRKQASARP